MFFILLLLSMFALACLSDKNNYTVDDFVRIFCCILSYVKKNLFFVVFNK